MEDYREKVTHFINYSKIKFSELIQRSKNNPPVFITNKGSIYPDANDYNEEHSTSKTL